MPHITARSSSISPYATSPLDRYSQVKKVAVNVKILHFVQDDKRKFRMTKEKF